MPNPEESTKCPLACNFCRVKKVKCNGTRPCTNCLDHRIECVFPPAHVRTRKKLRETNKMLQERLNRLEAMFQANVAAQSPGAQTSDTLKAPAPTTEQTSANSPPRPPLPPDFSDMIIVQTPASMEQGPNVIHQFVPSQNPVTTDLIDPQLSLTTTEPLQPCPMPPTPSSSEAEGRCFSQIYLPGPEPPNQERRFVQQARSTPTGQEDAVLSPTFSNSEHHGPVSYLSICSSPAMKWVSERVGTSAFAASASELSLSVTRGMKLDRKLAPEREREPDPDTAWKYTQAYFEGSLDIIFGVINRQRFEARLHAHFSGTAEDDFAWYALRNTMYAAGCKILLARDRLPQAFASAQDRAWRYFENALSVHTELIYVRSDLMAIEALVAMAFFTEGLGNPALEYMLISNALRLAQSKGLHRQPLQAWNMGEDEILDRNWLFWTIYVYEKHIAYRSGRPSAIDEDEISCRIPSKVVEGSTINAAFFNQVISHARITSNIARQLTSIKASQQPPEILVGKVQELERKLRDWYDSIDPDLKPQMPLQPMNLPSGTHRCHIIYLHFAFHGSLIAIHSLFTYPWDPTGLGADQRSSFHEQISNSTKMVVEASRQIVLATKWIDPHGSWPTWLTFFYPLLGLINIFIYVLRFPNLPSTPSDVALMDVAAGHFGYLEFLSGNKVTFPYINEIAGLARATVRRARMKMSPNTLMDTPPMPNPARFQNPMTDFATLMDTMDFGLENWPSFLPSLSTVSSMALNGFQDDDMAIMQFG